MPRHMCELPGSVEDQLLPFMDKLQVNPYIDLWGLCLKLSVSQKLERCHYRVAQFNLPPDFDELRKFSESEYVGIVYVESIVNRRQIVLAEVKSTRADGKPLQFAYLKPPGSSDPELGLTAGRPDARQVVRLHDPQSFIDNAPEDLLAWHVGKQFIEWLQQELTSTLGYRVKSWHNDGLKLRCTTTFAEFETGRRRSSVVSIAIDDVRICDGLTTQWSADDVQHGGAFKVPDSMLATMIALDRRE